MKLSIHTAAEMFEMINAESHVFYNTATGEFDHYNEYFAEDEETEPFEEAPWIAAPSHRDIGEYEIMAEFAEGISDPHKNELLSLALGGKGAFRRFKETLRRVGLTEEWYAFKHNAYGEIVKAWCEENRIAYKDDLTTPSPREKGEIVIMLDAIEAIHTRYSCRAFTDELPSDEELELIAKAAVASPSGVNRQFWRVIVVKNKTLLDDLEAEGMKNLAAFPDKSTYERILSRGGKLYYNAPCMIVVPIAKAEPAGAELFDCGIVSENIALAATALGVNSLICGLVVFSFSGEKGAAFKKQLGFPEGYEIGIAVLLGYAENPGGKPHEPDLDKITWIE